MSNACLFLREKLTNLASGENRAFAAELERQGLAATTELVPTGCMGLCGRGPLVTVQPGEVLYQQVVLFVGPGRKFFQTIIKFAGTGCFNIAVETHTEPLIIHGKTAVV